jgi:hypothetical protein
MNKYTEQHIEDQLGQIASIEPTRNSVRRMNRSVRNIITGTCKTPKSRSFLYYATASAAILLIGVSILYDFNPATKSPQPSIYSHSEPQLTLARLNAVFEAGGHKALDDHFEMVEQNRQPRAETITLQQIMKEL